MSAKLEMFGNVHLQSPGAIVLVLMLRHNPTGSDRDQVLVSADEGRRIVTSLAAYSGERDRCE